MLLLLVHGSAERRTVREATNVMPLGAIVGMRLGKDAICHGLAIRLSLISSSAIRPGPHVARWRRMQEC